MWSKAMLGYSRLSIILYIAGGKAVFTLTMTNNNYTGIS